MFPPLPGPFRPMLEKALTFLTQVLAVIAALLMLTMLLLPLIYL